MNVEQVTPVLQEHLDPELEALSVVRGPVGNGQETWFVEARAGDGGARRLVLRRSAPGGTLEWTDREQEYKVLRALGGRGLPVPEVYGLGTIERPYLLMELRPGAAAGRLSPEESRSLGRDLGASLARLHALDPAELGFEVPGAREAVLAQVDAWRTRYLEERAAPVPLLGALLAWAEQNAPDDDSVAVLLWGDPGPHNILVEGGRISAMLDWELSHVGHPLEDVGYACWACLGRLDPEDVVAGYEAEAGPVDRGTVAYFTALACATTSVMLVNGVAAWVEGRATSPSTAGLGLDLLAVNLARGTEAAGWGALPPPDGSAPELPFRPDPAESARGIARYLVAEVHPATEDKRVRRMLKSAGALLEATALRIPAPLGTRDLAAAEAEAVAAEQRGGDPAVRAALLADLSREAARLGPLTDFHGHPAPWKAPSVPG